jgi:hypothetical protein
MLLLTATVALHCCRPQSRTTCTALAVNPLVDCSANTTV